MNHLNTCPETVNTLSSSGSGQDLEFLETRLTRGASSERSEEAGLKFFDPLRSPDEEMIRMECELVKRAADMQSKVPINHDVTLHTNINLGADCLNEMRPRHRFKSSGSSAVVGSRAQSEGGGRGKPNIESFITKNLCGLDQIRSSAAKSQENTSKSSLSPQTFSAAQKKSFTISESIKEELMDRQRKALQDMKSKNNDQESSHYLSMDEHNKPSPKKAPPPPPTSSRKSKLRTTASCSTLCSTDSIYATVDKSKKRSVSRNSCENFYQSVDVSSVSHLDFRR